MQIGDKLQGLAPQATHFFIAGNGRAGWNQYRTRTNGNKRNFVFCMNQLGGVGAAKSQFKIRGLNKPDGTGNCLAGPYTLKDKIEYLRRYFLGLFPGYTLCLVGEHEQIRTDLEGCPCMDGSVLPESGDPFIHLTNAVSQQDMVNVSAQQQKALMQVFSNSLVRNMVVYVNSQCSYITGKGCSKQPLGVHTLGLVPNNMISVLNDCGYGLTKWEGIGVYATAPQCYDPNGSTTNADGSTVETYLTYSCDYYEPSGSYTMMAGNYITMDQAAEFGYSACDGCTDSHKPCCITGSNCSCAT